MRLSGLIQTAVALCAAASPLLAQQPGIYRIGPGEIIGSGVGGFNLIPVAVARDIAQTMPVAGSYSGASSTFAAMSVSVAVG